MKKKIGGRLAISIVVGVAFLVFLTAVFTADYLDVDYVSLVSKPSTYVGDAGESLVGDVVRFGSESEFREYLALREDDFYNGASTRMLNFTLNDGAIETVSMAERGELGVGGGDAPGRVSDTNVQVAGIDEPDIVKTDGDNIYFSSGFWSIFGRGEMGGGIVGVDMMFAPDIYPERRGSTRVIDAFPPEDLEVIFDVDLSGNLLLSDDTLVVFSGRDIVGYDVSDASAPSKSWEMELDSNNYLVDSRLYDETIYLVTQNNVSKVSPCIFRILEVGGESLEVRCTDIYHPVTPVPVDSTFTVIAVDVDSGEVQETVSFVGSSGSSVVYMSTGGIYVTYSYNESTVSFFSDFVDERAEDIFPALIQEKLDKLDGYNISERAKIVEFEVILNEHYSSLNADERLRVENELADRMSDYYKDHRRELEGTGIVKVGLDGLDIVALGEVSGRPLNQFALDEYDGNLRVAVTVGERGIYGFGFNVPRESVNDVYVLDENLEDLGSVRDLGVTERIYSARFIGDKGYLVTFKQTDPFYVLDLSNPRNPELKGELKIPGYSSYLHPIDDDTIVGVGKEGSQVKISLFDVSDLSDPKEADKYTLDEYWSEAVDNHHAFLMDQKHRVFFIPGGKGGYIFSYKGGDLRMEKAVSQASIKRALYLDDYMYIISEEGIVVLDENDWSEVGSLDF